ncbi:MAG: FHA domain-containing protein [Sulfuriflexus sp.]|nr:FHA domain-containing protein [Sulfuriflexus sp.]
MQCKVSFLTRKSRGGVTHIDEIVSGSSIRVGRSTENELYLSDFRVSLHHATIHDRQGRYYIEAESGSDLRVNNAIAQSTRLNKGDKIAVGPYDIEVISAEEGQDLDITIELVRQLGDDLEQLKQRSTTTLAATGFSRRRWSWVFYTIISLLFLVLPISAFFSDAVRDVFKDAPITADVAWKSGEFESAHTFFANDCKACHQEAFTTVRDTACATCHTETHTHADPQFFELSGLNETRCATCHKEHNGRDGLVRRDEGLCGDCHKDLDTTTGTDLTNVQDFGNNHPDFKATMFRFDARAKTFSTNREALKDKPVETSNLKFPHDKHLTVEGVDAPGGSRVMVCADCHQAEPGGIGMKPIVMKDHCSECHRLEFEADIPDRIVPHGNLEHILYTLTEYYGNLALKGGYDDLDAPAVVRNRRRPGQRITKRERKDAFLWAKQKAFDVGEDLFEDRVCSTCHDVTKVSDGNLRDGDAPKWEIAPVRLADTWLPKARFVHNKHQTMQCTDCHDAAKSEESGDVLIPAIDNCQQCHAGTEAAHNKIESTCVDCHGFHIAEDFLLGDRKGMPARKAMSATAERMDKNIK